MEEKDTTRFRKQVKENRRENKNVPYDELLEERQQIEREIEEALRQRRSS